MRDASVVLLTLILVSLLLDFAFGKWHERRSATVLSKSVQALTQGLSVAVLLFAFDRHVLPALAASVGFALCRLLIGWLVTKIRSGYAFVIQFVLQIAALVVIWLSAEGYWLWAWALGKDLFSAHNLLVLLAYVLVLRPASVLIGAVLTPFMAAVEQSSKDSLKKAGTWIGYLERTLILTFVLLGKWEAIGLLLTAKSILRFNDIKGAEQRPLSEYVLLGTLVSFTVSIAIGLAVAMLGGK
jgi:hypothetical protein